METPNTSENKAAFAAPYIGCDLAVIELPREHWYPFDEGEACLKLVGILNHQLIVGRIAEEVRDTYDQCCLSLKPLSQTTDEDAIALVDIVNKGSYPYNLENKIRYGISIARAMNENGSWMVGLSAVVQAADFLRSKSYLLPWRDLSVDDILRYGWAKYSNK